MDLHEQAGLDVEDRIRLELKSTDTTLLAAIQEFDQAIRDQTLSNTLEVGLNASHKVKVKIGDVELQICLQRV